MRDGRLSSLSAVGGPRPRQVATVHLRDDPGSGRGWSLVVLSQACYGGPERGWCDVRADRSRSGGLVRRGTLTPLPVGHWPEPLGWARTRWPLSGSSCARDAS
jgi:hypothetical protein